MNEPLIAQWLDDPSGLTDGQAREFGRLLESDPSLAAQLKEQLSLNHLLSLRLAVDRGNFEQQVGQRIRNAGSGARFTRQTLEAVLRSERRRSSWRLWIWEGAVAAVLLVGLLSLLLLRRDSTPPAVAPAAARRTGLKAEYYKDWRLTGAPLVRIDPQLDFTWPAGTGGPVPGSADIFSARWTGKILAPAPGRYTLRIRHDDGIRVWVGGKIVIDDWVGRPMVAESRGDVALETGKANDLKVEYFNGGDRGVLIFYWSTPTQPEEVIPASAFSHD